MSKIIFFDIDNTLTEDNSWERLNTAAGVTPEEDYVLYKEFHSGKISYKEWTDQLEYLYNTRQQLTQETAHQALTSFSIRYDAKSTIKQLQARGYEVVLLTGGFKTTAESLAHELNIKTFLYVTDLDFSNQKVNLVSKGEESEIKLQLAKEYCNTHKLDLTVQYAVGDSSNDIPLFKAVARSFVFTWSKDEVKEHSTDLIDNLRDVLKVL